MHLGPDELSVDLASVAASLRRGATFTFETHNVIDGADRVSPTVLHFHRLDWLVEQLADVGFGVVVVDGGWVGESFTSSSRLAVVRAELS